MYYIEKYGRYFAVMKDRQLICVCVYRRGARALIELLTATNQPPAMGVLFCPYVRRTSLILKNFALRGWIPLRASPAGVEVCLP